MRYIFTIMFCALVHLHSTAQTKMISFLANGGNSEEFAAEFNESTEPNSNMGMAPDSYVRTARLDSLIFVNDSVSIIVTSECNIKYSRNNNSKQWQPGRETAKKHYLFSKQHQLNFIKAEIEDKYNFVNDISTVKFIGYNNGVESTPEVTPNNSQGDTNAPANGNSPASIPSNNQQQYNQQPNSDYDNNLQQTIDSSKPQVNNIKIDTKNIKESKQKVSALNTNNKGFISNNKSSKYSNTSNTEKDAVLVLISIGLIIGASYLPYKVYS